MEPISFPQSNITLKGPLDLSPACGDLPVYTDGQICISLWKMTWSDRFRALFFGNLWLYVWSGNTQPPVGLIIDRTVFLSKEEEQWQVKEKQT